MPPSDAIVMNAWYVAAWSGELTTAPLARRIAGKAMLFFRSDGNATVLEDRSPAAATCST
jgi:phenylpropionate dioxygenase-like ring-hydroxylating dioxygenase large terminal subunit